MSESVHVLNGDAFVHDAVELMIKHDVSCLPVSLGQGPMGIVTERDILSRIIVPGRDSRRVKMKEIMSTPLIMGKVSMSIREAAKKMNDNNIRHLVIVDDKLTVKGLVTTSDIIKWMATNADALGDLQKYPPK